MNFEPHICFRGFDSSNALTERVNEEVRDLDHLFSKIIGCHVTLEHPHNRRHHGNHYRAKLDLFVPGRVLSVGRDPSAHRNFEDIYAAVNEGFAQLERMLLDYVNQRRGFVKARARSPHGRVVRLLPEKQCGFLITADEREVYFHQHSVLASGWSRIQVGSEVSFVEELGNNGPQASSVHLLSSALDVRVQP